MLITDEKFKRSLCTEVLIQFFFIILSLDNCEFTLRYCYNIIMYSIKFQNTTFNF